jgi:5-methylcytosine-specific restriction enzyme subunit McrC
MIPIKNIYYMLAYAYSDLKQKEYQSIDPENFDNAQNLFAAILIKGITYQLKQGLTRQYTEISEDLSVLRGKIDIAETIKLRLCRRNKLSCRYDELSENHYMNSILKTTAYALIKSKEVTAKNRALLKKLMLYFSDVSLLDLRDVKWNRLQYNRNNKSYKILMNICCLISEHMLPSDKSGAVKFAKFEDCKTMPWLYEKFILSYYKKHYPILNPKSRQVHWNSDDGFTGLLPVMQTDIFLSYDKKSLIIDAKYYSRAVQRQSIYNSTTLHSNNLYQIYTYVKNQDKTNSGNVEGMLLYAKTDENIDLNQEYSLGGNRFFVKNLDLNQDFPKICGQLNEIADIFMR